MDEFLEKMNYIANNPIKANPANGYEDYKRLYVKGWINVNLQTGKRPVLPSGDMDRRDACPTCRGGKLI